MARQVFFFFIYIFGAIVAYVYLSDNYENKKKPHTSILIVCGLYIICFFANIIFNNNFFINQNLSIIINVLYCRLSFKISVKSSLFHSCILVAIVLITEFIVEAGASVLLHIPIDAYKNSLTALILLGIISKALYFTVCKLISTLFSYKKNNAANDVKRNLSLFVYPVITTLMLSLLLYASATYKFSDTLNLICIVLSTVSLLFCCLIFIINRNFVKQENELIHLQAENARNEMNQSFYEMLEKKNEEQRILVHDFKHHLAAINSMDDIADIKKYVANVQPETRRHKHIGNTKNKMLDLILDRYANICQDKAIPFIVDIRSSNLDFIGNNDLVSMLSNLLDNALEAVEKTDNPMISFTTKRDRKFVIITVINTCAAKPKTVGKNLITTKSDTAFHGCGVKSIEKTIAKYSGICNWNYDETKKEFHFNILFNRQ